MKKGFTLIEIIVAVAIFAIIMTISMGSIVSVLESNRKARTLRNVMNNVNLALETMSREARFGRYYWCSTDASATPPAPPAVQNCNVLSTPGRIIRFVSSTGATIIYRFNNSSIERKVGSGAYVAVTAPQINITDLGFKVYGTSPTDTFQPNIFIKVEGSSGTGKTASSFYLQTFVTQRAIDRE